jgi:predicted metal-binding membrane protein
MIVAGALVALTALAWGYTLWLAPQEMDTGMAGGMAMDMPGMAPAFTAWTPAHFLLMFVMWAVMMVGMMTPSAAPMILLYAQVARQATTLGRSFASSGWFAAGYLSAWTLFALAATSAQYGLERAALLSPMTMSASRNLDGLVLIGAGLYQLTPIKSACLAQCRAPLAFVQRHGGFPASAWGSLRLGALHGLYCIGCCWALMALLFVGGVMNPLWIAGIAILVLVEKVVPQGRVVAWLAGFGAIAAGAWLLGHHA